MRNTYPHIPPAQNNVQAADAEAANSKGLPNRLLTTDEVAAFIGCHPETVRRAYQLGLLTCQRFGARGRRFHAADVHDWLRRGAPTKIE